jgi:hypothetical protein
MCKFSPGGNTPKSLREKNTFDLQIYANDPGGTARIPSVYYYDSISGAGAAMPRSRRPIGEG